MSTEQFDSQLGWMPAIPFAYCERGWWTLWRTRYMCECRRAFFDEADYKAHWMEMHAPSAHEVGDEGGAAK